MMTCSNKGKTRHDEDGFTLVELLVVLAIIGLLASLVAPQVIKHLSSAKATTAKVQVQRLAGILDIYHLEVGRYPTEQEGLAALIEKPLEAERWSGPYIRNPEALVDPWGHPYVYRVPGQQGDYDLYTLGADGQEGGDGDDQDIAASW
jgi:general secretion pathway protein G